MNFIKINANQAKKEWINLAFGVPESLLLAQ
jgi:hypothetical protein